MTSKDRRIVNGLDVTDWTEEEVEALMEKDAEVYGTDADDPDTNQTGLLGR